MTFITIKQLASLAKELDMNIVLLENKLESVDIKVQAKQQCIFRSKRRDIYRLYY